MDMNGTFFSITGHPHADQPQRGKIFFVRTSENHFVNKIFI